MHQYAVLISIPGLRQKDLASLPRLSSLVKSGATVPLTPSFPCVTCPVQATMTTGVSPGEHGVLANGFYWRDKSEVEMWTAWNDKVDAPQIWDRLHAHDSALTSAAWFPLLVKGAGADFICTPAPIHNPDGSESLWCYTKPAEFYGELRDQLGHFPLMHFWGPLANIKSTDWIVDSAVVGAKKFRPRFTYIYIPHLDYAAQKFGPDSPQAITALGEADAALGRLIDGFASAGLDDVLWVVAGEYAITPVDGAVFPNRILREAGLLALHEEEGLENLDPGQSKAWALVDHQFAHVFVRNSSDIAKVAELFRGQPGIAEVLSCDALREQGIANPRTGEIVLISEPTKWFAYYWWLDDAKAPKYARTVDIHQKPGYDPVELFIDMPARAIPLNASLVKGSHGYPADSPERQSVLLTSDAAALPGNEALRDIDVAGIVLRNFGVPAN
ncbi:MAG: alkaline phosphatase family protein [Planctomycetaceae bacterium]